MSLSVRYFLFEKDGTIRHIPKRVIEGLHAARDSLPQYSGQALRVVEVILDLSDGKPVRIEHLSGRVWRFDQDGKIGESHREALRLAMDSMPPIGATDDAVVQLEAVRLRRMLKAKHHWTPDPRAINRIIHAIWPKAAGRPVEPLKKVTGTRKRRAPMTHEARRAISLCVDSVMNIVHQIQGLKIPSLKAFTGKIGDNIEDDPPLDALVWKGAIAAAELQIEIERVWQSGSGKWFAVLESFHSSDERNVTDVRHVEHRECDGKMAAVVGCRELLAKHSGLFSEDTTIEAKIQSSLEWRPPKGAD
jgi:hypothetical protein